MPGGPSLIGLGGFAAVKLAGYTAAAVVLKKRCAGCRVHPLVAGGARTVIGIVAGVAACSAASAMGIGAPSIAFYLLLAPVRTFEWLVLFEWFFRDPKRARAETFTMAALGTFWSYVLDVPAILAIFVLPGGVWIC